MQMTSGGGIPLARRREGLFLLYGHPQRVDTAAALRVMGLREQIHPHDAIAIRYPTFEAAEAFAELNRELGNDVHGPLFVDDHPVSVIDLRRQMAAKGHGATDPALPDDWRLGD